MHNPVKRGKKLFFSKPITGLLPIITRKKKKEGKCGNVKPGVDSPQGITQRNCLTPLSMCFSVPADVLLFRLHYPYCPFIDLPRVPPSEFFFS